MGVCDDDQANLAAMSKGAILCRGYEGFEDVFWLEPRRIRIRSDVARQIIVLPGVVSGKDGLFDDSYAQTWRIAGVR
jgi:hypothetical protein